MFVSYAPVELHNVWVADKSVQLDLLDQLVDHAHLSGFGFVEFFYCADKTCGNVSV